MYNTHKEREGENEEWRAKGSVILTLQMQVDGGGREGRVPFPSCQLRQAQQTTCTGRELGVEMKG